MQKENDELKEKLAKLESGKASKESEVMKVDGAVVAEAAKNGVAT